MPPDAPARALEPELWPENEEAYEAFATLSSSRQMGMMALGYIPLSEVWAYAQMHEVGDAALLARKIRAADHVWVEWMNSEAKRDRDQRRQQR